MRYDEFIPFLIGDSNCVLDIVEWPKLGAVLRLMILSTEWANVYLPKSKGGTYNVTDTKVFNLASGGATIDSNLVSFSET